MRSAIGRAYQRIRGAHPRRPKSRLNFLVEVGCDLLLVLAAAACIGGLAAVAWAIAHGGLAVQPLIVGLTLLATSVGLLLLWEKVAWEPIVETLSKLS